MKKAMCCILLCLLFCFCACAEEREPYRYIMVYPSKVDAYWKTCVEGVLDASAECNADTLLIDMMLTDEVLFEEQLNRAIAAQVDGGLFSIHLPEKQNPLIRRMVEQGIPVITVDADSADSGRTAYVGTDPYKAGCAVGEAVLQGLDEAAKVGVLSVNVGGGGKLDIEIEGIRDTVSSCGGEIVEIVETEGILLNAYESTHKLLQEYPEINVIVGITSFDIQGAAKYVEENGIEDILLVGFDDLPETLDYIRKGVIYATIVQDPYQMGYQGVKLLTELCDGKTLSETEVDTGTTTVMLENLDHFLSEKE